LSVRSSYKLYFDHHKLIIGDAALTLCNKICVLIADDNRFITTCVPFARTLVVLHACGHCGITNKGLSLCMNLRELYADSNQYITTCAPFAKSLVVLSTRWYYYWDTPSFLDDNGIKMCTNLRELYIDDNHDITKCALFADTLEILSIKSSNICQMSNNEINACKKLRKVIR